MSSMPRFPAWRVILDHNLTDIINVLAIDKGMARAAIQDLRS